MGKRCEVLRVRQLVRMVTSTRTAKHLEFWLGGKMGENLITMEWFVMKPGARTGAKRVVVNTRPEYAKYFRSLGWVNRGNCVCCQKVSSFET